jgi:hypothetical protein
VSHFLPLRLVWAWICPNLLARTGESWAGVVRRTRYSPRTPSLRYVFLKQSNGPLNDSGLSVGWDWSLTLTAVSAGCDCTRTGIYLAAAHLGRRGVRKLWQSSQPPSPSADLLVVTPGQATSACMDATDLACHTSGNSTTCRLAAGLTLPQTMLLNADGPSSDPLISYVAAVRWSDGKLLLRWV